ncbi:hypothetical protein Bhyg_03836 [Pseudolycoriella hygida]|uniref:Uncharacterized protein n=1 Tax=Pseudolycoriella hygida TaxID=35572 RepID=A0A9Q0NFB4_9DIPT|nr:hypothetical protein Bhyg_03836 [Pseudolycoriella hygida]
MNFCEDFANIQSIFNYFNEFVKPLHKLQIRGGNEIYITEIADKLRRYLISKNYTTTDNEVQHQLYATELRKITFYLILNTEATFKYNLSEDYNVVHILGTIPPISKMLLLSLIWELHLNEYFYECVAYAPIWFSLQFVDVAVDSLKFADPYQVLDCVEKLVCAIYLNITRSDYRTMGVVDKKIILGKYFDHTMDFLRHFFTPDSEKFSNFSKFKYSLYTGHVLHHNLTMIMKCFVLYKTKPELDVDKKLLIYSLMSEKDKIVDNHNQVYSEPVNDTLHKINTALLNSLQTNVMMVNIDTFLNWVEEDIDEDRTLQSVVGEAAYEVSNLIQLNECFKHDVLAQLQSLVIKPLTVEERAKKSTIGEILNKVDNMSSENETRSIWITELISRGVLVFENDECMETLEQNVTHFSVENVLEILNYIKTAEEVEENVKLLIVNSIKHLSQKEIEKIVQQVAVMQLETNRTIELDNFDQSLIEVFNKSAQMLYSKFSFRVMVQNPISFYKAIFNRAIHNEQEASDLTKFIAATKDISLGFMEHELKNLLEVEFDGHDVKVRSAIPKFMGQLFFTDLIPKPQFIQTWLYKPLTKALSEKNYVKIVCLLKTLLIISHKFDFEKLCPPVLAMCAQVLDSCRWDIIKYTEELEDIVTTSIEVIGEAIKKFLPKGTDADKKWILTKTSTFKPMTRYYFHKLSLNIPDKPMKFDQFIFGANFENLSRQEKTGILCETFIRCTRKEAEWLAKNERLHPYFKDVMLVVFEIVKKTDNPNSLNCVMFCMQSYIKVVLDSIASCATTTSEKINLICHQFQVFTSMQTLRIYDQLLLNAYPMILSLVERFRDDIVTSQSKFRSSIESLADCEAKTLLLTQFGTFFE